MGDKSDLIETAADRLLELVRQKKSIAIKEAAKELGVSSAIIQEWAEFLEDEGIVTIKYKVTTPYISEKKLSKKEIDSKVKSFMENKDVLLRKAESTLDFLNHQGEEIGNVRKEFDHIKKEVDTDITSVKKKLTQLHDVLRDIKAKEKEIEDEVKKGEEASSRFQNFVTHKADLEKMLAKVSDDKDLLRKEVSKLIMAAKALNIAMDDEENRKHIDELQQKFLEVDKRRNVFLTEIKELVKLLKGK